MDVSANRIVPVLESLDESAKETAGHTAGMKKANTELSSINSNVESVRSEIRDLKKVVSGLDRSLQTLIELNRKILQQK